MTFLKCILISITPLGGTEGEKDPRELFFPTFPSIKGRIKFRYAKFTIERLEEMPGKHTCRMREKWHMTTRLSISPISCFTDAEIKASERVR